MSEAENKKAGHEEDKDEVEAHRRLTEEAKSEEDKDEVEAHRNKLAATDEGDTDESESDDDVEAHRNKMI